MIVGSKLEGRLRHSLHRAAEIGGGPVLVSVVEPIAAIDPLDVFHWGQKFGRRFYWRPSDGPAICGVGAAWTVDRARADRSWQKLVGGAIVDGAAAPCTGPILTACLAFDSIRRSTSLWQDFPLDSLVLPRLLVTTDGNRSWLTVNAVLPSQEAADAGDCNASLREPCAEVERLLASRECSANVGSLNAANAGSLTPASAGSRVLRSHAAPFRDLVAEGIAAIRGGALKKIVLARGVDVTGSWSQSSILSSLRASYPGCTTFAVAGDGSCFLGATPEGLIRLRQGEAQVPCVAGTAPRGRTEEEDRRLGESLLADAKNRQEHGLVVNAIRQSLMDVVTDLAVADEPTLMVLPNLQHLYTPITCRRRADQSFLSLVERLHPTPAMAGFPRDEAMAFIREREGLDRGGYAGPIGWIDRQGEGEFAIAIRSALLRGNRGMAFAGCGIVADSDPENEVLESSLKLLPILTALGVPDAAD